MKNKAFTLIELLVTIAIISLLAAIVFASVSSAREKAQDSHKVTEAKEVEKAIELYRLDNNDLVPFASSTTKGVLHEEGTTPYNDAMNQLVTGGYISTIPESPSGTDYAYKVSEDGKSAMFYSNQSDSSSTGDVCVRIGSDTFDQTGTGYSCDGSLAAASTDETCFGFSGGIITSFSGSCGGQDVDVIIPSTHGGETVTGIGSYAFYNDYLNALIIPDSVTSISDYAVISTSVTSVTIPNTITSIGRYSFRYNHYLNNVIIPNSVTSIGYGAFSDNANLSSVTIPDSVTSISDYAFYNTPLTSVSLKTGTTIGTAAFPSNCTITFR